jgi:hypothetical protein
MTQKLLLFVILLALATVPAFACQAGPFPFENRFSYVCVNEKTGTPIWGAEVVNSTLFVEYLKPYANVADVQVGLNSQGRWKGKFFGGNRVLNITVWRNSFGAVWISLDGTKNSPTMK